MGSRYRTVLIGGGLEPDEASLDDFARSRGVEFEVIDTMRRSIDPIQDGLALQKLTSRLRALKPDIVHTHTAKAGALGRIAARLAAVPLVVHTFHGHVFDGYFSPLRTRGFVEAERRLAGLSDAIVAISERQRNDLVDRYKIAPSRKVKLIPLGLDLDRFLTIQPGQEGIRGELSIGTSDPLIVSVGRLVPIKRFDLLIDAFDLFREKRPNAHLAIAGDGEERARLEDRAAKSKNVHLLGMRRDLPRIYGPADLFVLSSDNEGTPVAAIEALASGLPVVATDVGGIRDFLTPDLGILASRGSHHGLAEAMSRALLLPKPGREGRIRVASRFSADRLIGDITALYDGLLETGPLGRRWYSGPMSW